MGRISAEFGRFSYGISCHMIFVIANMPIISKNSSLLERQDSNLLSGITNVTPQCIFARTEGLEPPTTGFGDQRSTNWTTSAWYVISLKAFCALSGNRTHAPRIKSPQLYHSAIRALYCTPTGTRTQDSRIKSPMLWNHWAIEANKYTKCLRRDSNPRPAG